MSRLRTLRIALLALIAAWAAAGGCAERGRETIARPPAPVDATPQAPVETPPADATQQAPADATPQASPEVAPEALPRPQRAVIAPFEGVEVDRLNGIVRVRAWVALDAGYLEQIVCTPGTREHESLLIVTVRPSDLHAALLIAGFESGAPGRWEFDPETEEVTLIPPRGEKLDLLVRYERDGEPIEESIREWIVDAEGELAFPPDPWVFGGSMFRPNPEFMGPGEHYVADMSGSVVGLVTFGDEMIGFSHVISDQAAIHEPEWMVNPDRIPPVDTEVTLVIRRAKGNSPQSTQRPQRMN